MGRNYAEELEREVKAIKDLDANDQRNDWNIGRHYNYIVDNRLAEENGFKRSKDFIEQKLSGFSQRTLSRYGAVARYFQQEDAAKHGSSKLADLLAYLGLRGIHPGATPPDKVMVKVPKDGAEMEKPFPDCTRTDLQAAIHHLSPAPAERLSEHDAARVKRLQDATSETGAHVVLKVNPHHGDPLVTLSNVPLNHLPEVLKTLLEAAEQLAKEDGAAAVAASLSAASPAQATG